jgi:DNA primase
VRRREHVADRPQVLVRVVDGQFRGEPFAQQPAAAAFPVVVRARQRLGGVQQGQRPAGQVRPGVLAGGGVVGKGTVALAHPQVGAGHRIEGDELVDIGVGDLAGQRALRL